VPVEDIEARVCEVSRAETPRRLRRLKYHALRKHSSLGVSEIARRFGRSPAAISIAVKGLDAEAASNPDLKAGFERLARTLIPIQAVEDPVTEVEESTT